MNPQQEDYCIPSHKVWLNLYRRDFSLGVFDTKVWFLYFNHVARYVKFSLLGLYCWAKEKMASCTPRVSNTWLVLELEGTKRCMFLGTVYAIIIIIFVTESRQNAHTQSPLAAGCPRKKDYYAHCK
jgi:hypothetical protein